PSQDPTQWANSPIGPRTSKEPRLSTHPSAELNQDGGGGSEARTALSRRSTVVNGRRHGVSDHLLHVRFSPHHSKIVSPTQNKIERLTCKGRDSYKESAASALRAMRIIGC
ncbi:hypothetical protein AKJ16_DCAP19325, partial [Drosera capensis]